MTAERLPIDPIAIRGCAQQIITAHVDGAHDIRDGLITEYVALHGSELLNCVLGFVQYYAFEDLHPDDDAGAIAVPIFKGSLELLGDVIEMIGDGDSEAVTDITIALATATYDGSATPEDAPILEAAQTCLLVHMLVRRGSRPWGVQRNLDLSDMRLVIRALSDMLATIVNDTREHLGEERLIAVLLNCVQSILEGLAALRGHPVKGYMQAY